MKARPHVTKLDHSCTSQCHAPSTIQLLVLIFFLMLSEIRIIPTRPVNLIFMPFVSHYGRTNLKLHPIKTHHSPRIPVLAGLSTTFDKTRLVACNKPNTETEHSSLHVACKSEILIFASYSRSRASLQYYHCCFNDF
jgi:hypothetical protein